MTKRRKDAIDKWDKKTTLQAMVLTGESRSDGVNWAKLMVNTRWHWGCCTNWWRRAYKTQMARKGERATFKQKSVLYWSEDLLENWQETGKLFPSSSLLPSVEIQKKNWKVSFSVLIFAIVCSVTQTSRECKKCPNWGKSRVSISPSPSVYIYLSFRQKDWLRSKADRRGGRWWSSPRVANKRATSAKEV